MDMGHKIEVQEALSQIFLPSNYCAPIKVAPVERAMPAIP